MRSNGRKVVFPVCLLAVAGFLFGCAGREFAPKRQIWFYHKELPAADRALAAAKAAGKDKECPEAYKYAGEMRDDAYKIYEACRTKEGIAMANEAAAMAKGLCPALPLPTPAKMAPPPPPMAPPPPAPPPPAPAAAPTVSLSASPPSIEKGKCTELTWSSTNASNASIDKGIGDVSSGGSRQVCPDTTTQYTITAAGEGGTRTATTTVTVNPPPPPAPKVVDRLTIHVNFDTNKADIRKDDVPDLEKAVDFVKKYPGYAISVEGHTDDRGSAKYNKSLSEKRAAAVKSYLLSHGVKDGDKIKTEGFGEDKPVADNKTEKGRFENRRVEVLIISN